MHSSNVAKTQPYSVAYALIHVRRCFHAGSTLPSTSSNRCTSNSRPISLLLRHACMPLRAITSRSYVVLQVISHRSFEVSRSFNVGLDALAYIAGIGDVWTACFLKLLNDNITADWMYCWQWNSPASSSQRIDNRIRNRTKQRMLSRKIKT